MPKRSRSIDTHEKRAFSCDDAGCSYIARLRGTLNAHKRTHNTTRPFKCDFEGCNYAAKQHSALAVHKLKHTGLRKHGCTWSGCSFTCATSGQLTEHVRRHVGVKPYTCDECTSTFVSSGDMKKHSRQVHLQLWQYKCSQCEYVSKTNRSLMQHTLTHGEDRAYRCTIAGCVFASKQPQGLRSHMLTHNDTRKYACTFPNCTYKARRTHHLKEHESTHKGIKPYACSVDGCGARFTQRVQCKRHAYSQHTADGQARQRKDEERLAKALKANDVDFKREHMIDFACAVVGADVMKKRDFARIDFVVVQDGVINCIECDEDQHMGYGQGCETRRMMRIVEAFTLDGNTLPVRFVRFNPDSFKVDGVKQKVKYDARISALKYVLVEPMPDRPVTIKYLFYDTTTGQPDVLSDPSYDEAVKALVVV